jgi:hypothetical protein
LQKRFSIAPRGARRSTSFRNRRHSSGPFFNDIGWTRAISRPKAWPVAGFPSRLPAFFHHERRAQLKASAFSAILIERTFNMT